MGNVTRVSAGNGLYVETKSYDALGRLVSENECGVSKSYSYDIGGHTLSSSVGGVSTSYTYDVLGRLASVSGGGVSASYSYNAVGCPTLVSYGNGVKQSYTYNAANLITKIATAKGSSNLKQETYSYYADGNRSSYMSFAGNTVTTAYDALGRLTNEHSTGANAYDKSCTYDARGNRAKLIVAGGETVIYTYDAFGLELSLVASDANPLRYSGEYFDAESGDYYLRARYYNPRLGRFLTEDPVRDGNNWYVYCNNNPVRYVDPSGENPLLIFVGVGIVGGVVGAVVDFGTQLIDNGGDLSGIEWRSVGAAATAGVVTAEMGLMSAGASLGLAGTTAAGALIGGAGYETYHIVNGSEATTGGLAISMISGGVMNAAGYIFINRSGTVGNSGVKVGSSSSAKGLIGHDFEDYLTKNMAEMVHLKLLEANLMAGLVIAFCRKGEIIKNHPFRDGFNYT